MRKLFLLLFVIPFVFNSCSDDDKDAIVLENTTWEWSETWESTSYIRTITFGKSTFDYRVREVFNSSYIKDYDETFSGIYTYKHPKITLIDESGHKDVITVQSNTSLVQIMEDDEDDPVIFRKK